MIKKTTILICAFFLLTIISLPISNSAQEKLSSSEQSKLIETTCELLIENYVFPEVAEQIEQHLEQKLEKGEFKGIKTKEEFAQRLTLEMESVANDLHLRCRYKYSSSIERKNQRRDFSEDYKKISNLKDFRFFRTGKIDKHIGYLEILGFPSPASAKESYDAAMKTISDSKVLIIDLRRNGGGSPDMIRYVCSYFFEKPTHLNSIYWRNLNKTVDYITLENVDGKKMSKVQVYVLTSSFTVSGGEEFAYNIQTQKRGILIGEITAGGANPGEVFNINDDYSIFIPTGTAINPITKTNWEGVGVKPDIESISYNAFDLAVKLLSLNNKK